MSAIDVAIPPEGNPTTAGVRANFATAKSEIEALEAALAVLPETVQDTVAGLLVAGANITITYDDVANTLTIAANTTGVSDGDKGDIVVSGSGTVWTVEAAAWAAITGKPTLGTASALDVAATGDAAAGEVVKGNDSRLTDARTPLTHAHTAAAVTDFSEAVDDRVALLLQAGANIALTYDDGLNTLTIAVTGLGTAAALNVPATGDAASGEVVKGSDTRLTDARTPTAHSQETATIQYPAALKIGDPTHLDDLQEVLNHLWSSGVTDGWDLTDNADGTVSLTSGSALLRASADAHTSLYSVALPVVTNLALTDGAANYIYADYNSGTPAVGVTTSTTGFNCLDKCVAWKVTREGTKLYVVDARSQNVDGNRLMRRLFLNFSEYIPHAGGTVLSATGTRNIAVSAGGFSFMVQDIPHTGFDTSVAGTANANVIAQYKHVAGVWTRVADEKQIDNLYYDNGTDLVALSSGRYGIRWIYAIPDSPTQLAYVLANSNSGSIATTEAVPPPTVAQLPPALAYGGVLIGRIIIEKDASTFYSVQSVASTTFAAAGETLPVTDTTALVQGSTDSTKRVRMEVDGLTTGTTRVLTVPDSDLTLAGTNVGQTFARPQKAGTLALTHNTAWDGSLATGAQHLTVDVNGSSFTIANPSAQEDGLIYMVYVTYTTTHSIAWGTVFKGLTGVTATATAGAVDAFMFRSNGTNLINVGYALNGGA